MRRNYLAQMGADLVNDNVLIIHKSRAREGGMTPPEMTRAEYESAVCARVDEAIRVPFRRVSLPDWSPKVAECHQNTDAWVRANPGVAAVRGWVTYASFGGDSVGLTAHSIVRDQSGVLVDITPLADESARAGMRFVEHEGDPALFDEMKAVDINIYCNCLEFSAAELMMAEPSQEIFDEIGEQE